jgi:cytochrome P450
MDPIEAVPRRTPTAYAVNRFRGQTFSHRHGELLARRYRRRGLVSGMGPNVYLLGPDANRFIFTNSQLFRWREAFEGLVPLAGLTALFVSDGEAHRRRRRHVAPGLHYRQIEHYLDAIAENADIAIRSWRPGQRVDIYHALRSTILHIIIESLFGQRLAADSPFLGEQLEQLLDLVEHPPLVAWKRRLATPQWRRAMIARAKLDERVYTAIERARSDTTDVQGLLTGLVHAGLAGGDALSDEEIRDQFVGLVAAGYDTSSAAIGSAIYAMLSTPGVWDTAAAEVRDVLGGRRPGIDDLNRLVYLRGVVFETLRLYPPIVVSARKVVQDFEFGGQRIKAGRLLLYSPYVAHRLAELWPDPLCFRPERWDTTQPGYRKPGIGEYLPFSAGPHRCIGSELATTELTVMLARLLAQTSLYLPAQRIRGTNLGIMRPAHGLCVEVRG